VHLSDLLESFLDLFLVLLVFLGVKILNATSKVAFATAEATFFYCESAAAAG